MLAVAMTLQAYASKIYASKRHRSAIHLLILWTGYFTPNRMLPPFTLLVAFKECMTCIDAAELEDC